MSENCRGIILKGIGGFYTVDIGTDTVECRARGRLRHDRTVPLAGDRVEISVLPDKSGRLEQILPRNNWFTRPAVANIDRLVIVASQAPPVTEPRLIDAMTSMAAYKGIRVILCLNKCDVTPADDLYRIYTHAGFPVFCVSAQTGQGIEPLLREISGKVCAFTGNSGVGKSSLLNRLEPGFSLAVGQMSEKLGRGKHTTRHVELFKLAGGALIADTPGFSAFDFDEFDAESRGRLQETFIDFAPYSDKCRFIGCAHISDSGCAVRAAVDAGDLEQSRYLSYVRMYEDTGKIARYGK